LANPGDAVGSSFPYGRPNDNPERSEAAMDTDHVETVIIGGGQAGLSMGYHLTRRGRPCVILDGNPRVGDSWRNRWDSLRLFTPGRFCGLDGMAFPGPAGTAPTKDEMADYLAAYAARFELPVRPGVKVERVTKSDGRFVVDAGDRRLESDQVVVATGAFHDAWTPAFADQLDPRIVQLHSSAYRGPSQLREGGVLLVGAGNSGADIALDVARTHRTWLSGRHPGHIPFAIENAPTRHLVRVVRFLGHHVLTRRTPIGRKVLPKLAVGGDPLIRIKPKDLVAAGVECVPRVAGVRDGLPLVGDDAVLDVANVIWCTGFRQSFPWIDLPVFDDDGRPVHDRGVVAAEPGLYFLGLKFQFGATSDIITGVGRDARYIAKHIDAHGKSSRAAVLTEEMVA
jgi:putative flavoprotein involved in K+ transport